MATEHVANGDGGNDALVEGKSLAAHLHAIALETPDPQALAAFYVRAMGFSFGLDGQRSIGFALDRRLTLTPGTARKLSEACFVLDDGSNLGCLERRLQTSGVGYCRGPYGPFSDTLSFADPDGNRMRFIQGDASEKQVPCIGASANRTARLQHLVLASTQAERLIRFYCDIVGFRTSDTVLDDVGVVRTAFLNCGPEHHSLAVFAASENRLDHFCFEAGDWGLIRDWADHFSSEKIPLEWGPGRHGPGNNLFVFIHDLDGNWVEVSAELERVAPDRPTGTWRHEERTLNSWGTGLLRS